MKKKLILSICLIGILFFNVYANNEVYKKQLTNELLEIMNTRLNELQIEWKIKKDEIIPKFQSELKTLRDTYSKDDFEYDIIQELIDSLVLKESEKNNWEKQQNEQTETEKTGKNSWENTSEENQNNTWEDTPQPRGPSIKIDENALQEAKPLTPEEKQAIELYIKELQEEEKSNVHLNKPRTQRDIFDILKEDFMFEDFGKNKNGW